MLRRRQAEDVVEDELACYVIPAPVAGVYFDRQLFGVDPTADQARHLVPDGTGIDRPVPVGGEPTGLLRSAEQVWAVSWPAWTPTISISSLPCCGMSAAAARHVIPQMTPQGSGCDD